MYRCARRFVATDAPDSRDRARARARTSGDTLLRLDYISARSTFQHSSLEVGDFRRAGVHTELFVIVRRALASRSSERPTISNKFNELSHSYRCVLAACSLAGQPLA